MLLQCDSIRASEPAQAIQKKPAQANPRKTSRKASALSDARHPRKIRSTIFSIVYSTIKAGRADTIRLGQVDIRYKS